MSKPQRIGQRYVVKEIVNNVGFVTANIRPTRNSQFTVGRIDLDPAVWRRFVSWPEKQFVYTTNFMYSGYSLYAVRNFIVLWSVDVQSEHCSDQSLFGGFFNDAARRFQCVENEQWHIVVQVIDSYRQNS